MADNTPIANPAVSLAWIQKLGRGWRTLFPTLTADAVGDEPTVHQRHPHRTCWTDYTVSIPIPNWLPPADVVVNVIIGAMFQTAIIIHTVHMLLFHGGGR